ncbi:MAG: class II aldolase/adducin family protein [Gammaproteobacteria bacterium]|nr:class II aldolase/adducin family protein [Gammaproteobacteria bacterium]
MQNSQAELQRLVRKTARALGRHGLAHAYGHCSQRLDARHFLVCAAKPLKTIRPGEEGMIVPVDGPLPEGVLGEVRIHQQIYRTRPDIGGVVRSMPPQLMALSVMGCVPRLVHGMSAYFHEGVAYWDDPQLIRDDARAEALVKTMQSRLGLVMRGNGSVVAGDSLMEALVLTWYLEDAARIELACLKAGREPRLLSLEEARRRATRHGRIFERMWDYLTDGDSE